MPGGVFCVMADIKFACPACQQHLQAEPAYAGLEINCPSCHNKMVVPGTPIPRAVPVAAPAPAYAIASAPAYAAPPPPTHAAPPASASVNCPSCGTPLSRGAAICNHCGYNLSTGKRPIAGPSGARRKSGGSGQSSTIPWIFIGIYLPTMGALAYSSRGNTTVLLAVGGVAFLYTIVIAVITLIAAFKESTGTGFLTLCLPFFVLYFVYVVNENKTLKILFIPVALYLLMSLVNLILQGLRSLG
jgi:hypothetical protein